MSSGLQVIQSLPSPSGAMLSGGNAVVLPCLHCSDPRSEACLGDGLCHNGSRRERGPLWATPLPPSEWQSDDQCRAAYRKAGEQWWMKVVPCRYCNGYKHLLIGPDGTPVPIGLPEA